MSKKEKFKKWCKDNKTYIIGGGLLIAGCAGAAFGLTKVFKPDNSINPVVVDLNKLGILGDILLQVEANGYGCELYSCYEGYKVKDLGKFGEDMLGWEGLPDQITTDTVLKGILLISEKEKTE